MLAFGYKGFDPQWTLRPTAAARPRCSPLWARTVRRECHEPVCQMANYTYGVGGNILWDHANIDPPTHRWIAREFGWVPITFFRQMSRCAAAGHLVAASGFDEIPEDVVASAPRNRPRWTLPRGLGATAASCPQPGALVRLAGRPGARPARAGGGCPGYTHLDVFFGARRRARRVRARRRGATARNFQPPGELESAERDCSGSLSTPRAVWSRSHHGPRSAAAAALRRPARGALPDGLRRCVRGHPRPLSPAAARLHAPDAGRRRARTPRTSCRTSSCAPTARCATTTGR